MPFSRAQLLASTALFASLLALPQNTQALELNDGDVITASVPGGLFDTDDPAGSIAVVIISSSGAITLGASGTPALGSDGDVANPITVTASGSNTITFAGSVLGQNAGDVIDINSTANLVFQDIVTSNGGTITMGDGSKTLAVTFDTDGAENLTVDAAVNAAGAGDVITMNVTNTNGGAANTLTFNGAIGGAADATTIDTINIGAGTTAIFNDTVRAGAIAVNSVKTTTFNDDVTGAITMGANGTLAFAADTGLTGSIDNTSGGVLGTITFGTSTGNVTLVSGNIGASKAFTAINATAGKGTTQTFGGTVNATTVTLSGLGTTAFSGNVTGNVNVAADGIVSFAANKGLTGALDNTSGGTAGTINFGTSTSNVTLVSGAVGATNAFTAINANAGKGTTQTFGSTVQANTITLSGTGTTAFSDTVTATTKIDMTGDGTVTLAADKQIAGNVDSSADNQGTLTFAATTADTHLVTGTVGATHALKAVNVAPATGITVTFDDTYSVGTTTHSGAGTLAFTDTVAGNINISGGGILTLTEAMTGAIDNTGTAGTGTLNLSAHTADVSSNIGAGSALGTINVTNTGGTVILGGTVAATNINLAGAGTTQFSKGATGAINFAANNTASVSANYGITGAVTTSTNSTGTLSFGIATANTTFTTSTVGTTDKRLLAVNASAFTGITTTFTGAVHADTITLTGADNTSVFAFGSDIDATTLALQIGGKVNIANNINLDAAVTASADDVGVLNFAGTSTVSSNVGAVGAGNRLGGFNVNAGTVTVAAGKTVAASTIAIASGSTLETAGALTIEGALNNNGTLTLGGTLTATAGGGTIDLANASNGTLHLAAASAYTGGTIIDASGVNVNLTKALTITPDATFRSGTLKLVDTNAGAGTADDDLSKYTLTDRILYAYTLSTDANHDIILSVQKRSVAEVASRLDVNSSAAAAFSAGMEATVADTAVADAYDTAVTGGSASAKRAAEQSMENATGFASQAMSATAHAASNVIADRMSGSRGGVQLASLNQTGFAAGNGFRRNTAWSKVFGNVAEQDDRGGYAGYDADTYGIAFGMDRKMSEKVLIGAAVSYAATSVDGKDLGRSKTDIDSYQLSVYGSYGSSAPGRYYMGRFFIEGMLAYAFNQVDTSRLIDFGGLNRKASGKYDANQFSASVGFGVPLAVASFVVTPKAGLFYSRSSGDTYTETGAGSMNLSVDPGSVSFLESSFGASASKTFKTRSGGSLRPELRGALLFDLIDDEITATSRYAGSGANFTTQGLRPDSFGTTFGLGVEYTSRTGNWDVSADYDAEMREDYVSHNGMLTGRIHF